MPTPQDTPQSVILRLIVAEIQDTDDGILKQNITYLWNYYAAKAYVSPYLQELYTRRHAIDMVIGSLRLSADTTLGSDLAQKQQQWIANLTTMRGLVQIEIVTVEKKARALRTPIVKSINGPLSPMTRGLPDPNDPYYRGDPNALWEDLNLYGTVPGVIVE